MPRAQAQARAQLLPIAGDATTAAADSAACLTQRSRQHFHASVEHILVLANLHYLANLSNKNRFAFFNDLRYTIERVANTFADCTEEICNLLTCIVDALTQN